MTLLELILLIRSRLERPNDDKPDKSRSRARSNIMMRPYTGIVLSSGFEWGDSDDVDADVIILDDDVVYLRDDLLIPLDDAQAAIDSMDRDYSVVWSAESTASVRVSSGGVV